MQFYNGKPQKIFNINVKKKGYVTYNDIEDCAFQNENNYFYMYNFFSNMQVSRINGLSGSVFNYFFGLNENVQDYMNDTRETLTGYTYNPLIDTTIIDNNFQTLNVECVDLASEHMASNTININKINCDKISNTTLKSNQINCNTLKCKYLEYENNIAMYLYFNNITIPINKTIERDELNFTDNVTNIKITLLPNYSVELLDNNNFVLFELRNDTDKIKYYQNVTVNAFTKIKIYLRNILIV